MFLNPLSLRNEIFPYWLLFLPLIFKNIPAFIFCLITLTLGLVNYFLYTELRSIIDCFSIISTILGLYIYISLNDQEKRSLCNVFIMFIILTFVTMVYQKISPEFHNFTLKLFSSRNDLAFFYIQRNAAVTGFSPEPAYGSALIVGLMLILFLNHKLTNFIYILILTELFLFRSITGILYFIYASLIIFALDFKTFLKHKLSLLAFIAIFAIFFITDLKVFINRPFLFFNTLFTSRDLLEAEKLFGSQRVVNVFDSFKLFNPIYSTGFSPFAVFSNLSHTFLIPVIILLIYILPIGISMSFILSLPFLFFGGPTLLWPLQALLTERVKKW
jgi:hypothetical protein